MPEQMNNQNFDSINNSSKMDQVSGRISGVAHNVMDRFSNVRGMIPQRIQDNRVLMYAGVGLLLVGAGFGIWSLVSSFRGSELDEQSSMYGSENFNRRSY